MDRSASRTPEAPLVGAVAFISGGASGIGLSTARLLASRGASVALFDRDESAARAAARGLTEDGAKAIALQGDTAVTADVAGAVNATVERYGGITSAIACAGIDTVGEVDVLDEEAWARCMGVNLTGVFLVAKYSVPHLLRCERATFVAVSSAAGLRGLAGEPAYSASKAGVIGLIKTMALDYGGHGLRCNAVCPGFTETPMVAHYFAHLAPEGARKMREQRIPLGRLGDPDEVAQLIAHLVSDESSYTNGGAHVIDGGAYAGYWKHEAW